jgi:VWFA-related protein
MVTTRRSFQALVASFLLTILASSAPAAVLRFEFTGERTGDPPLRFVGHGFVDRQASRYDYDRGNHPLFAERMSIRSADGGRILAIVDGNEGTYFFRATEPMSGLMSNFRAPWQTGIESPDVRVENLGREASVQGLQVSRVRITIRYRILMALDGEPMSADVDAAAELLVAPKYRNPALPWGHQFALKTGWPEIDRRVADEVVKLGFPLHQTVTVTRTIEGGSQLTERSTFDVVSFREVAFAAAGFSPPPGFRAMEPTLVGPALADTGLDEDPVRPDEIPATTSAPGTPPVKTTSALPIEVIDPRTAPPLFVETMEVRVVNVDVVVRDKRGNPVSGLTREDFSVLENGQPVEITNFLEMSTSTGSLAATTEEPSATEELTEMAQAPATDAAKRHRRKIVLYLDQLALHPSNRKRLVPAMKQFLVDAMRPGDEVMIASFENGLQVDLQFTSSRDVALEVIGRMEDRVALSHGRAKQLADVQQQLYDNILDWQPDLPPYSAGLSDARSYANAVTHQTNLTIGSLEALMKGLQSVDGRKILVFATEALPARPGNEIFIFFDSIKHLYAGGANEVPLTEMLDYDLSAKIDALADVANQTSFTLYPVQAQSLSSGFTSAEISGTMAVRFVEGTNNSDAVRRASDAEGLQTIARLTGGIATLGSNDFTLAFDSIVSDLEHYYSIGYRATGEPSDFVRTIRVTMKNPDHVARTRRSHVDRSIETEMEEYVAANLFYPIDRNDLGISVTASEPKPAGENATLTLTIEIPTASLTLIPRDEEVFGSFTLFIGFVRADGSVSKIARDARQFKFPASTMPRRKSVTMALEVTMDATTDRISVGVLDPVSKATGFASAFVPVTSTTTEEP